MTHDGARRDEGHRADPRARSSPSWRPSKFSLTPRSRVILLLAPAAEGRALALALQAALQGEPHSLVDVSHRQTALEISGPRATEILNSGCPLDLDPAAFPVGMCTRTVFAKAEIVLWRSSIDVFRLEVWRSFTDYVARYLAQVAREH